MNLEEAKTLLKGAVKHELRDHAFGDCEVDWTIGDDKVATGYFGGSDRHVSVRVNANMWHSTRFMNYEADELRKCFASEAVERNDETGPDDFVVGRTMPGLTLEGVRKELTGEEN